MSQPKVSFDDVRVFLRVVERGSFTGAARQLGLPLTSVSRRVKALEQILGVQLLHRTTRRLSITEAGQDFYSRCAQSEQMLDEAVLTLRELRSTPEGTLRVAVPYAPGLLVLEPRLAEFRRRYPRIQLALTYSNEPLDLLSHGLDVALRTGPLDDSGYVARRLGRSRAILVASPGYLGGAGTPNHPHELNTHAVLAAGNEAPLATWTLQHGNGDTQSITLRPVLVANESATVIRQALAGGGIALQSRYLVESHLADGSLVQVLPDWHRSPDVDLSALYSKRATLESKVRVFVAFAEEVFATWNPDAPATTIAAKIASPGSD